MSPPFSNSAPLLSGHVFFILFLFLIFPHFGKAQHKDWDSIIRSLPQSVANRNDFDRVQQLRLHLWPDAIEHTTQAYHRLEPFVRKAERWVHVHGNQRDLLSNYLLQLLLFEKVGDDEKTLVLGNRLLQYESSYTPTEVNKISGILYNTYRKLEAYHEVIRLIPILEKYEDVPDPWRPKGYTIRYDLAMINFKNEDYLAAAKGFQVQKKIFDSVGNPLLASSMDNNTGLCYYQLKKYDTAFAYYQSALQALKKPGKPTAPPLEPEYMHYFEWVIRGNMADIAYDRGLFPEALSIYSAQREAWIPTGEYPIRTSLFLNLSKTYLALHQLRLAKAYSDSSLISLNNYIATDTKADCYAHAGKVLLALGAIDSARTHFTRAVVLQDSIRHLRIARDNLVARVKYDSDEKEKELQKALLDIQVQEEVQTRQWIIIAVVALVLLVSVYSYLKSRKDKKTIDRQRRILEGSVKEKEILLKEVHHRVKNNLQVISGLLQLQATKLKGAKEVALFRESQQQIRSIAAVHEMLYQQEDSASVPMERYLEQLSQQLLQSTPDISVSVEAPSINLSLNTAIPIGLMVSELITNTQKHAFDTLEGQVYISLEAPVLDHYLLTYKDTGKGLPPHYEAQLGDTMGLRLLHMLAEEIKGKMHLQTQNGFTATLTFSDL